VEQEITDVPSSQVGSVVQTFIDAGNQTVTVSPQPNGLYTVRGR